MPSIEWSDINIWAVLTAALATFLIGGAWYGAIFAKPWQKAHGYSDEMMKQMQADRPPPAFFGTMLVSYVVMAFAMAVVISLAGVTTLAGGASIGLLAWVVVAAVGMTGHVATPWPFAAFLIDAVYQIIYLGITGAILGAWR